MWRIINFILIFCYTGSYVRGDGMIEVFKWKQMDYYNRGDNTNNLVDGIAFTIRPRPEPDSIIFPDHPDCNKHALNKRQAPKITSRSQLPNTSVQSDTSIPTDMPTYVPYNNVPMGVTHFRGRLFISMPRRRVGIPSTLNYVDMRREGSNPSPKLIAYPNYETNYLNPTTLRPNANGLVSVYRTSVDDCQRLWFIDTGMLEYPDNHMQIQRPAIWVIDLKTDRVLNRFEIPENIAETGQGLASVTIDVEPSQCQNAFAYIPDLVNNRFSVYSLAENLIWAFNHNYFRMDPLAGDFNVGGQSFRWDDGIFAITLGSRDNNGYRQAFFHALASNNEFVVSTEVLQEESNAARSDHGNDFRLLGSRGVNKQSITHEYDPRTGVIFYTEIQQNGIGCWNSKNPFTPEFHGTVFKDAQRMIYPSDLTLDENGTIWTMSNTLPVFNYANLNPNEYNFRVWKQNVFEAIKNTACQ